MKEKQITVIVSEIREREVFITVDDNNEFRSKLMKKAVDKAKEMYENGEIVLEKSDIIDTDFETEPVAWV